MMRCGVYTCARDPNNKTNCLNNGGTGGKLTGNISDACLRALPVLASLGIRAELWLGEDGSYSSARYLFDHAEDTAQDLIALSEAHPTIVGFNIDLEPWSYATNASDTALLAAFLGDVTAALSSEGLRFSADVTCYDGGQHECMTCTRAAREIASRRRRRDDPP